MRVCQPTRRRSPKRISAPVEMIASVRVILGGKYELSRPVYSTKRENVPQATFGCPNCPYRPNLSATAERNERPSANRKNTELKLPHLLIAKGKTVCSKCLNEGRCDAGDKGVFIFIDPLLLTVKRLPISVAGPSGHHPSCSKAISDGTPCNALSILISCLLFGRETHASTTQSDPLLLPTRNGRYREDGALRSKLYLGA